MSEPTISAISPFLSALRNLPIWILCGLALAGLAILYAPSFGGIDPSDLRKEFGVWIWAGIIICATLAVVRSIDFRIASYVNNRQNRATNTKKYIILIKTIHEKLLASGRFHNKDYIDGCIKRLEQSEDSVWAEDKVRHARYDFIDHARSAFQVRMLHDDYRNNMERSETKAYLDNSKDRLIAALLNQRLPDLFYPPGEDAPFSWSERMVARARHWRIFQKK